MVFRLELVYHISQNIVFGLSWFGKNSFLKN
jgi:hypothetical protein